MKYKMREFCHLYPMREDQETLDMALVKSVQNNDMTTTMRLIATGANVAVKWGDESLLELAKRYRSEFFMNAPGSHSHTLVIFSSIIFICSLLFFAGRNNHSKLRYLRFMALESTITRVPISLLVERITVRLSFVHAVVENDFTTLPT